MRDSTIAAAGSQYQAPKEGTWVQRRYDRLRNRQPGMSEVDWLPSGNLVIRRVVFEQIGGFDKELEACEDVDLCQRIVRGGGRLVSSDRLSSVHKGDPPTLRALFFGELWRGRDNLRVSLRSPLKIRSLPSLGFPIVHLLALVTVLGGLLTLNAGGWRLAA